MNLVMTAWPGIFGVALLVAALAVAVFRAWRDKKAEFRTLVRMQAVRYFIDTVEGFTPGVWVTGNTNRMRLTHGAGTALILEITSRSAQLVPDAQVKVSAVFVTNEQPLKMRGFTARLDGRGSMPVSLDADGNLLATHGGSVVSVRLIPDALRTWADIYATAAGLNQPAAS